MSTQLDYGQIGTAISKLYGSDDQEHHALGNLLEVLLTMHNETGIDLNHLPQVDALARLIAPTDFDCCTTGTPAHDPDDDPVNHPSHYTSHPSGVECITVTEHMGFNVGNAVKYLWRADEKGNALEDLEKARWYVTRELERRAAL